MEGQRKVIRQYAREQGMAIVGTYGDAPKSGLRNGD
jgi:hypothetical protein